MARRGTATLVFLDPTSQKLDVEGYQNYPNVTTSMAAWTSATSWRPTSP